jgi:hypothetical protein
MEVISIGDRGEKKRKQNLLEVLANLQKQVEAGEVNEFVIASVDKDGEVAVHACVDDFLGGVGLIEIGKQILMAQQQVDFDD